MRWIAGHATPPFIQAGGKPVGLAWTRLAVTLCIALAGNEALCPSFTHRASEIPSIHLELRMVCPSHLGIERDQIETRLKKLPGKQIVIVRYAPDHIDFDGWVYNSADIDDSKVIWAQDIDPASNLELIRYYKDRKVWLVQREEIRCRFSLSDNRPAGRRLH